MELLQIAKSKRLSQQQAEAGVRPLAILQAEDGADSLGVLTSLCEEVSFPLDREDRATLQSMEALLFKLGGWVIRCICIPICFITPGGVGLAAPQVGVKKVVVHFWI